MMHEIIDPNFIHSTAEEIDAMKAAMNGHASQTLEEIRISSELLADKDDGELHQIALDSGYTFNQHD